MKMEKNYDQYIYKFPINVEKEWGKLFKPDYKFKKVNLKVKYLKNCFVNHYGLVIKNGLLVKGCAPNIGFSTYDESFYFKHWRKAIEQCIVSKRGKSIKSVNLTDDSKYLLIHSPWFSYYFWITECLPRLLMVKDQLDELVLIYPESWDNFTFVTETLELFPNLKIIKIDIDVHLRVKNLVMPEVKPWTPMFIPESVLQVRKFLFQSLDDKKITSPIQTERVYISRAGAKRRKFSDENKVETLMEKYGFSIVRMEELSFFEQIALMRQTKYMTAMTGAGLINILFMQSGGGFLDLTNEEYKHKSQYKFHYFKLCNILKINYGVSFFKSLNDHTVDHYSNQNLLLDENQLINDIKMILNV
jgi:hypothetical protein